MKVRPADLRDVPAYVALGQDAQTRLQLRGLGQYVPAAHDEHASAIRSRVEAGTLFAVDEGGTTIGYFSLDQQPSPWWPADGVPAVYLAGMVVARSARGQGVGGFIIGWCLQEADRHGCRLVRLDCHAGNPWLRRYYESHGFELRGRIEQHPGYEGCLYERRVAPPAGAKDP